MRLGRRCELKPMFQILQFALVFENGFIAKTKDSRQLFNLDQIFLLIQPYKRIEQWNIRARRDSTSYTQSVPKKVTYKCKSNCHQIVEL